MKRLALGLLLFSATALHAVSYQVFDLPALGGSLTTTTGAYDISENGWVAGYSGGGTLRLIDPATGAPLGDPGSRRREM